MAPRAEIGRVLDNNLITRTHTLLQNYNEIPLMQFADIFYQRFDQILDAESIGFNNGLFGFFSQLYPLVLIIQKREGQYYCTAGKQYEPTIEPLRFNALIPLIKQVHLRRRLGGLFDPKNTLLWCHRYGYLLSSNTMIEIASSPLERALQLDRTRVMREIELIQSAMSRYPKGVRLNDICTIHRFDKRLFNTPSLDTFVMEYPELFFREDSESDEQEPLIFDGKTKTYDLSNYNLKHLNCTAEIISFKSIRSGIYQKTLLLLRQVGTQGLKLGVWSETMDINFKETQEVELYEKHIKELAPLDLFMALAAVGLVELKSSKDFKNDIRIHFPPKKIVFHEFMDKLLMTIATQQKVLDEQSLNQCYTL